MSEELERAQAEALKRLDTDNALTLKEPEVAASTISKVASLRLRQCAKSAEEVAAEAESRQRGERIAFWQLLTTKIGDRYGNCRLDRWKFHGKDDEQSRQRAVVSQVVAYQGQIPERVHGGSGVFLFGPPGTGKDFLVSALMREAVLTYGIKVEWANGVDLFANIRDAIGGETSERKLVSQWVAPKILSLSDPLPPRGMLTDFQASMLFRIVDQRYRAMRPTWVTLNVKNKAEAEERIGPQTVSRLLDGALGCRCEWSDYRAIVHK